MIEALGKLIPGVESPKRAISFKERLKWTGIILFIFLSMGFISLYGVEPSTYEHLHYMQMILASKMGSLTTLGIGPIVMASIILQLLVGTKVLPLDLTKPEDRERFELYQKVGIVFFCFFEAATYVLLGAIRPRAPDPFLILLLILQLACGGLLVMLFDEVVSKWGIGSGVSLFIAAGVCKEIFIRAFNPFTFGSEIPAGLIPQFFIMLGMGDLSSAFDAILPVISTILIVFLVVYVNGIKVEIPLAFGSISGFGRRWPLKFIYTSNIPVILIAALLANLQMMGAMLANKGVPILGEFDAQGNPTSGFVYYITVPHALILSLLHGAFSSDLLLRALGHVLFFVIGSVIFSVLWVETAGMDAKSVAKQITSIGLQIPGFRRDPRIVEQVLSRYIMPLAVMGGAFVGFLAAFANFMGALGTGTGILLTVMIIYNFYETIAYRYMEEMHPALRKFFEG